VAPYNGSSSAISKRNNAPRDVSIVSDSVLKHTWIDVGARFGGAHVAQPFVAFSACIGGQRTEP